MNNEITCSDYYNGKPQPKVLKTVMPEKPIRNFNLWIQWVYKQVKKAA